MPFPCRSSAALIHICHAATLPFSDSAVSFVKVRVVDENIRAAILLLVTTFVELRVVAGRSRSPTCRFWTADANSHITMPFPRRSHAALCRALERSLSERHGRGMAGERHGICESNTAALCKSNRKDTI
jgi:hypothetical protein